MIYYIFSSKHFCKVVKDTDSVFERLEFVMRECINENVMIAVVANYDKIKKQPVEVPEFLKQNARTLIFRYQVGEAIKNNNMELAITLANTYQKTLSK